MPTDLTFTDPDGDGVGGWTADVTTSVDLSAVIAYIDQRFDALMVSPKFTGVGGT